MARTEDFSASEIVQIGFKLLADSRAGPGADLGLPVGRKAQIFQKKHYMEWRNFSAIGGWDVRPLDPPLRTPLDPISFIFMQFLVE